MTAIVFDCLILPDQCPELAGALRVRLDQWIAADRLGTATVTESAGDGEDPQLLAQWEQEHPDEPVGDRRMRQFRVDIEGLQGSVNKLTMDLATLLTPPIDLPEDPVLREFDAELQGTATFPWHVRVER